MNARLTDKPLSDVLAAIQTLDLESVKTRLMDAEIGNGWTPDYAQRIETAYKVYLSMLAKYPNDAEDIMLAKDVDEFWHTHILQTLKYTNDCMRVFGRYLHHEPHVGARTAEDIQRRESNAHKTRAIYEKEFGSTDGAAGAWAGSAASSQEPAYSAVLIPEQGLAYSAATLDAKRAAYSAAKIGAAQAAYSAANAIGENGAYSAAQVSSRDAAYSAAKIQAEDAAYSAASITSRPTGESTAAIRARDSAYSAATIGSVNAAQ